MNDIGEYMEGIPDTHLIINMISIVVQLTISMAVART